MPSDTASAGRYRRLSELVAHVEDIRPPAAINARYDEREGQCMICGLGGPIRPLQGTHGVFSGAFTSHNLLGDGDGVCYRCAYLAADMDHRRYHWVITTDEWRIIKERPELIDVLLDPPEGPWMLQYKDGSDFLTVLNGWIAGQRLNTSRERYRIIVDKQTVGFERAELEEMIAFGRDLRDREDAISKKALIHGPTAGDLGRYDIGREEYARIAGRDGYDGWAGREDWRIAVQLIE